MRKAYLYQRFSSEVQRGNSSEERQLDLQLQWLEENKDRAIQAEGKIMLDDGFSAYKGEHLKYGDLGKFFIAIDNGLVERGSFLLVENFTRLTRFDITPSEDLVKKLWAADITIVTVSDGTEYIPADSNDAVTRSRLLFEFDRAFKEIEWHKKKIAYSYTKRFNDFMKDKTKPAMRRPFWLNKEGELNGMQDSVVRMFELCAEGYGQVRISRILKEEFPNYEPIQNMNPTTIIRWITSDIVKGIWKKEKMFPSPVTETQLLNAIDAYTVRFNRHKSVNVRRNWPLSGLFRCGHCISSKKTNEHSGMTIQQTQNSLPVLRCSFRQRKANNEAICAEKGEPTTFPYILAHWFFINVVQQKALMKYSSLNSDAELKVKLKENNIEVARLERAIDETKSSFRKLANEGKSVSALAEMLSELESEFNLVTNRRAELLHQLANLNKYIISPEASELIDDVVKFNNTMHELGIEIVIKNRTLYFEGEKGYEYLGYCKKTKEYEYFDHVFLQRKCPVPLPHDVDILLMDDSKAIRGMFDDKASIDARLLMHIF
ncbi:MAG: hypothetical protein ACJA1Z_002848 [Patiriisocius sp.]|jgi:hypothetical protein